MKSPTKQNENTREKVPISLSNQFKYLSQLEETMEEEIQIILSIETTSTEHASVQISSQSNVKSGDVSLQHKINTGNIFETPMESNVDPLYPRMEDQDAFNDA
jgi:hypothetical protein